MDFINFIKNVQCRSNNSNDGSKGHLVNCMILRIKLNTHDVSINLIEDLE